MNLPEETRKQLKNVYGDLSEELYIFFFSLRDEGFSHEDAMTILCTIIGRADGFISNYKQRCSKSEKMETLKKHLKDRKAKVQEGEPIS